MSKLRSHLLVASLISCASFAALAQVNPALPASPGTAGSPGAKPAMHQRGEHLGRHDPAKFAERKARRQAELKAKLNITPAQESAWSSFTQAIQPPAARPPRPSREEFAQLTTPERIDRMQAIRAERDARMAKRASATKTFYAALTPDQQKVFDASTLRRPGRHGHHGMHGRDSRG